MAAPYYKLPGQGITEEDVGLEPHHLKSYEWKMTTRKLRVCSQACEGLDVSKGKPYNHREVNGAN